MYGFSIVCTPTTSCLCTSDGYPKREEGREGGLDILSGLSIYMSIVCTRNTHVDYTHHLLPMHFRWISKAPGIVPSNHQNSGKIIVGGSFTSNHAKIQAKNTENQTA